MKYDNPTYPLKEIIYADGVDLFIYVPVAEESNFIEWMTEMTNGQAQIVSVDNKFLEFDE